MPTQPHMVEALLRSQLMAHMTDDERRDLALRFEVRPFSAGQTLIADGSEGRKLLEILAGTAEVRVRDGEHGYRVAQLGPGSISGEAAFYAGTARGAERAGTSSILDGLAAKSLWEGLIDVAEDLVFDSPLRPPLDILLELTPRLVRVRPVKPRQDPRAHLREKARGLWVRSNHLIDGQGPLD